MGDRRNLPERWPAALSGPYLERKLEEWFPDSRISVTLRAGDGGRSSRKKARNHAFGEVAGDASVNQLHHRPDGRPEIDGKTKVSVAYAEGFTLAAATTGAPVGCDLEPVRRRSEALWTDLLGAKHAELMNLVTREMPGEDGDEAGTRVWSALEAAKKAGFQPDTPLLLEPPAALDDRWIVFSAGGRRIATWIARVIGAPDAICLAFAGRCSCASTRRRSARRCSSRSWPW